jgi:hypothetical protein
MFTKHPKHGRGGIHVYLLFFPVDVQIENGHGIKISMKPFYDIPVRLKPDKVMNWQALL